MTAQLNMTSGTCMMDTYNILMKRQEILLMILERDES